MSAERLARLLLQMIDSLDRERDLLIAGDYDRLAEEATARQERMLAIANHNLDGIPALAPLLERLRAGITRNTGLLRAALDGAAAGQRRIAEILAARTSLTGYDASGAPVDRTTRIADGRRA
jgi:hypothetical protein